MFARVAPVMIGVCLLAGTRVAEAQDAPAPAPPLTSTAPPMAAADVEHIRQLAADVRHLELRREEAGLALPIATIVVGAAVLGVGVGVAVAHNGDEPKQCAGDAPCFNDDFLPFLAGGLTAVIGGGITTVGTIWTVKRVRERNALTKEISAKEEEMLLIRTPRVGFAPTRDGGGLVTLAGSF